MKTTTPTEVTLKTAEFLALKGINCIPFGNSIKMAVDGIEDYVTFTPRIKGMATGYTQLTEEQALDALSIFVTNTQLTSRVDYKRYMVMYNGMLSDNITEGNIIGHTPKKLPGINQIVIACGGRWLAEEVKNALAAGK
jgi:hypothetical protein